MKTRIVLALCLFLPLLSLNSCNKGSGLTPTVSTFTLTLPDGHSYIVESGNYSPVFPDHDLAASAFCNTEQFGVLMTSIRLSEQDQIAGKELSPQPILFGIIASNNSNDLTDSYSGHVYLESKTESTLVFRFDNVRFTIGKGSFTANGLLVCNKVERGDVYVTGK